MAVVILFSCIESFNFLAFEVVSFRSTLTSFPPALLDPALIRLTLTSIPPALPDQALIRLTLTSIPPALPGQALIRSTLTSIHSILTLIHLSLTSVRLTPFRLQPKRLELPHWRPQNLRGRLGVPGFRGKHDVYAFIEALKEHGSLEIMRISCLSGPLAGRPRDCGSE